MRYTELITSQNMNEGRSWTHADDAKLLQDQIKSEDNTRFTNFFAPDVNITHAVKVLSDISSCKWFFNFLVLKLHELNAIRVNSVHFYMHKFDNKWDIWAIDENEDVHVYTTPNDGFFPFEAITLQATYSSGFWHVSLIEVIEHVTS